MDTATAHREVVFVVFDGVKLLDAVGPGEVFAEANRFGAHYRLHFASLDGNDVMTSLGTRFSVTRSVDDVGQVDTVMVAGGDGLVGRPIDPRLVDAVKQLQGVPGVWHLCAPARSSWPRRVCSTVEGLPHIGVTHGC